MSGQINYLGRSFLFLTIFVIGAMIIGCTTVVRMYPGPERPMEEIATLEITNVVVRALDTMPVSGTMLEILPGEHYLRMNHNKDGYPDMMATYIFTAKPGHRYSLGADYKIGHGLSMDPWVLDLTDNVRIGTWKR